MGELYQIGLDIRGGPEIDFSVRHVPSFVSGNRITDGIDRGLSHARDWPLLIS